MITEKDIELSIVDALKDAGVTVKADDIKSFSAMALKIVSSAMSRVHMSPAFLGNVSVIVDAESKRKVPVDLRFG